MTTSFLKYGPLFLKVLLLIFTAALVTLCLVPPISRDALVHHLAVPALYLASGGIYEIPSLVFSYYPMNLDLLYMLPLYFGNDIFPKLIHQCFGLLTAWLIFSYLKEKISRIYALWGVILFLSIPVIVKLSITVYVDLGLVFFSTAALLFMLKWRADGLRLRYLMVSAVFCGLGMGTKYNGLITFLLITLFVVYIYSRQSGRVRHGAAKSVGHGLLYCCIALLVFSPWAIRNYRCTHNPVFPLYDGVFNPVSSDGGGSGANESVQKQIKNFGVFTYRSFAYNETWWEMLLLPVRVFFQGKDGSGRYFDGRLNPLLLILPLFSLGKSGAASGVRADRNIFFLFSLLYFAFVLFSRDLRVRYLSPILPFLVILSVFGMKNIREGLLRMRHPAMRQAATGLSGVVFIVLLGLNGQYLFSQFNYVKPVEYICGAVSRDEYITRYRPEYPAMRYINAHLPSDSRILFLFIGKRGYYCHRKYLFDASRNQSILSSLVKNATDTEAIVTGLHKKQISHLLIRHDIFQRWAREQFAGEKLTLLNAFLKEYTTLLFFERGYAVMALAPGH